MKQAQAQQVIQNVKVVLADAKQKRRKRRRKKANQVVNKEMMALLPRIELAGRIPPPQSGTNLANILLAQRLNELTKPSGLASHLPLLKGGTVPSAEEGRGLLSALDLQERGGLADEVKSPEGSVNITTYGRKLDFDGMTPATQGAQADEAMRRFLKANITYVPLNERQTQSQRLAQLDTLQANRLRELYAQTRQVMSRSGVGEVIEPAPDSGQYQPTPASGFRSMLSGMKLDLNRLTKSDA